MGKILYGYVSNSFEWNANDCACEECMALDGKVYGSADEIPDKPHPNCKCHINVIENKENNPLGELRAELKERNNLHNELKKLIGEIHSLEEDIEEILNFLTFNFSNLIRNHRTNSYKKLFNKLDDLKKEIYIFDDELSEYNRYVDVQPLDTVNDNLKKAKAKIGNFHNITDDIIVNLSNKTVADWGGKAFNAFYKTPEAYELYRFASPNFNNNPEYVQKNGTLYKSINDIKNVNMKNEIKARVRNDSSKNDCKVLYLNASSSMSVKIKNSPEFINFLASNTELLKPNGSISQKTIEFFETPDLYNALHGAIIKNARTDSNGNLSLTVEDFWDFNAGRTSVKGRVGEKLQNQGMLENFYIIIDIKLSAKEIAHLKIN